MATLTPDKLWYKWNGWYVRNGVGQRLRKNLRHCVVHWWVTLRLLVHKQPAMSSLTLLTIYLLSQVYYFNWFRSLVLFTTIIRPERMSCDQFGVSTCRDATNNLVGKVSVNLTAMSWATLDRLHPTVRVGGHWEPPECHSCHHVAVVVPYRERDAHLRVFLNHIHPILQRQMLQYSIYVIEQDPDSAFNRGMLMNVGYVEALKNAPYRCFVFSDVDLLPEDDRNMYDCPLQPRHMSVAVNTFEYELAYEEIFGGVENFRTEHFRAVNGFSNLYFGWGGEDDDLYNRVHHAGYSITRPPSQVARYTMNVHHKIFGNHSRYNNIVETLHGWRAYRHSGLSSLHYKVTRRESRRLYTFISVKLDQRQILQEARKVTNHKQTLASLRSRDVYT